MKASERALFYDILLPNSYSNNKGDKTEQRKIAVATPAPYKNKG